MTKTKYIYLKCSANCSIFVDPSANVKVLRTVPVKLALPISKRVQVAIKAGALVEITQEEFEEMTTATPSPGAEVSADTEDGAEELDAEELAEMTQKELVALCKERGLKITPEIKDLSGDEKKEALIDLLMGE